VALETSRRHRRSAIVGAGTPDGAAVPPYDLGLGSGASRHGPCQGAHATDGLFEDLLGMAVGLRERLGGFRQGVQVPQVVGPLGSSLSDRGTAGPWPIGDAAPHGHLQGLLHLTEQCGSGVVGGRQEAAGQEHCARETIAQAPEAFRPDVRLEPIASEAAPALRLRQAPPPRRILAGERDQGVVALQQLGHGPGRSGETALKHGLMDGRHTVVVGRALRADAGQDLEATRVLGQGQAPCRCGPVWLAPLGARRLEAAPHLEGEPHEGLQGGESAIGVRGGPQRLTAAGTLAHNRLQGLRMGGGRSECGTGQRLHLQLSG
jgi:hypothetical protein